MKTITNSFEETQKLGESFAQKLHGGDVLLLFGNLGAGKTTFLQGLAKGLGVERRIISPTFIIVRSYELPNVILVNEVHPGSDSGQAPLQSSKYSWGARMTAHWFYHIDLYRTQTENDLKGLGIPEILEDKKAIVAIEWPEKLGSFAPQSRWEIRFDTIDENRREIIIEKFSI